jgi:phosphate acyltransferase
MDMVKDGQADAFVSAGNTGAAVAAATLKLRTLPGVDRAGIASAMPNEFGLCHILDAGANPEAKPEHLVAYAVMGTAFTRNVLGVKNPKVGLMSNGEEEEKGTAFTKETFKLLKQTPGIISSATSRAAICSRPSSTWCLCDGFVGNIMLKTVEATAKAVSKWLKTEIKGNPLRMPARCSPTARSRRSRRKAAMKPTAAARCSASTAWSSSPTALPPPWPSAMPSAWPWKPSNTG